MKWEESKSRAQLLNQKGEPVLPVSELCVRYSSITLISFYWLQDFTQDSKRKRLMLILRLIAHYNIKF